MNKFVRDDGVVVRLINNKMFGVIRMVQFPHSPFTPWFAGVDVARSLGYAVPRDAVNNLPVNKMIFNLESINWLIEPRNYVRRITSNTSLIDEGSLYIMIMRSSLPKAEEFQRWIAYKVIPAIANGTINQVSDILQDEFSEFGICDRRGQIEQRKEFTSSIAQNLRQSSNMYPKMTNAIYQGILGKTASELKEASGDINEKKLREKLRPEIRIMITSAENNAREYVQNKSNKNATITDDDVDRVRRDTQLLYGNNPYSFDHNNFPVHIFPFSDIQQYSDSISKLYDTTEEDNK